MAKNAINNLPLNIGDIVYVLVYDFVAEGTKEAWTMTRSEVTDISVHHGFCVACDSYIPKGSFKQIDTFRPWDELGERVFISKEVAESYIRLHGNTTEYIYEEK